MRNRVVWLSDGPVPRSGFCFSTTVAVGGRCGCAVGGLCEKPDVFVFCTPSQPSTLVWACALGKCVVHCESKIGTTSEFSKVAGASVL